MKITLDEVRQVFEKLLSNALSREEADHWARSVVQESEKDKIIFVPQEDQEKIWAGVMYLYGVDIKDSPTEYLNSLDDIRTAMSKIFFS